MKISTKGRYAVRLMLDVAIHGMDKNVSMRDVAERQNISIKYLEQIVSILTRVGYLKSVRGAQGCLLYTSPSPRDGLLSRMPSSA